jgi:lysophospholipase L1-like esterase
MKKILIFCAAVFLFVIVIYFFLNKNYPIKNMPPKNEKILIFGDSLAEGIGSSEGNDLASLLEKDLRKAVINDGKSGDTTRDALERLPLVVEEKPGIVIVILGGNDVLKKIPQTETFANLEKIVTSLQDNGSVVIVFGVRSGLLGDGRGDEFKALAKKTGTWYLSDILGGLFGDTRYMSDSVHPNDAGYGLIEKRILPVINKIYKK